MNDSLDNAQSNQREQWPDFCKGVAILLVILGHSIGYVSSAGGGISCTLEVLDRWIYSFHMALFFFISGHLQKLSEQKGNNDAARTTKRIISLIGPYIIFSIIFWAFKKLFSASIANPVTIKDLLLIWIFPLSDLWFLYALLVFFLTHVLLIRINVNRYFVFAITVIVSIFAMSYEWHGIVTQTALPRICEYWAFYYAGLLFPQCRKISKENMNKYGIGGILVFVLGLVVFTLSYDYSGLAAGVCNLLVACCNVATLVIMGMLVRSKPVQYLGENSLYIFLVHDYAVCATVILLRRFISINSIMVLMATLMGCCCSIFVIQLCKKCKYFDMIFRPQLILKSRKK